MRSIAVLDAERDAEQWRELLSELPPCLNDVYFQPEYVAMHRLEPGSEGVMFAYREGSYSWCYPFLLNPVPRYLLSAPAAYDIEAAYGYGGPISSTEDAEFLSRAHAVFREWCGEKNVVAEFVRFHPLLGNERWVERSVTIVDDRETVSIALSGNVQFSKDVEYMARRAERVGVALREANPVTDGHEFISLYRSTMARLSADSYYYFSDTYFDALFHFVQHHGTMTIAELEGNVVAASIFLRSSDWLHYHLSCSNYSSRIPGVTNQVIRRAAQDGAARGQRTFHLGGGRSSSPEDSLLAFKKKMGTNVHTFRIGRRIVSAEMYAETRQHWVEQYPSLVARYGGRLLCYRYKA